MKNRRNLFRVAQLVVATVVITSVGLGQAPKAEALSASISIDAGNVQGVIQPTITGQMAEWAQDEMNGAWAERLRNRSFEDTSTTASNERVLYDSFTGAALDRSKWTPMSLDAATAGTAAVSSSAVTLTSSMPGRWGIMSNTLGESRYAGTTVEAKISSLSGTNAILSIYGGAGAGDFSKFVEFAIEGGVLKVHADGVSTWTGGVATVPAVMKVVVSPKEGSVRNIGFYYNGSLVYTLSGYTLLPNDLRAFVYNWSGSLVVDYVTVSHDATYDSFGGTSLSPRWTPTLLAGATAGTATVGSGLLQLAGTASSRYVALSEPIQNSAVDWTTVSARLQSVSGTNGLMSIYGGGGTGDFSKFMEFGVEGGIAKAFGSDGYTWTGNAVTLPATIAVQASPYYANGRIFRFLVNGTQVAEIWDQKSVPVGNFRVGLYGFGTSVTQWDRVDVSAVHFWDQYAPNFEGGPGLSVEWTPVSLAGSWGTAAQGNSQLTVNGAAASRYGALSTRLEESDVYGYTIQAKLDSISGTNGLLDIYAGAGRGDFTKFVEFGIEGGLLKVYGDGITSWTGGAATTPAILRVEVGAWTASGRNMYFYYNNALVYSLEGATVIGNQEYQVFAYGYGSTTTKWDYITSWRNETWASDGYADVATSSLVGSAFNGQNAKQVVIAQHTSGRQGIAQRDVKVTAGKQYQFSAWLKQSGLSAPVTVYVGPASGDGPSYSPYATASISGVSGSWTKYTGTFTPTTTDNFAKLFIGAAGTGTLSIDMPSLMPLDSSEVSYGGWRPEFVNSIDTLKPVSIRWPGGIIADSYHWADGVGDRDRRAPIYYAQWDAQWMTNDVGTHEVLDLAAQLGLKVMLNINWGQGSTTEAANWVEYVNGSTGTTYGALRNTNGHAAPWGVKLWEIGNEVWGGWTPGHTTAANYANSYLTYRDAMYAKDNSIEFVGEGGDGTNADQSWNTTMVQTTASKLDQLAVHYYSPQVLPQNYSSSNLYLSSVGGAVTYAGRLAATGDTILTNTTDDIKIAVLEHAAMYFNEEQRRTRTLEGGLVEAGMLNLLLRRPDLNEVNAASTLVNFWDGGSFRIGNRGSFATPAFEVQKLVSAYHGPLLVGSTTTSSTYTAPAVGNLPSTSGVPYLDVTTTMSADGTKLYVSVLNRDPAAATTTSITLANAGAISSSGMAYTVNSPNYLDQNSWQNKTLVQSTSSAITGVGSSFNYSFPAHSYTVLALTIAAGARTLPAVTGRVTTAAGVAISGANVQIVGGSSTTTNANGYFLITGVTPGTYSVTVSKTGFTSYTRNQLEVSTTGATTLPIRLVP